MSTDNDLKNTVGILEQVLEREGRREELEKLRQNEKKIIVVRGEHDKIEKVFDALQVPYKAIEQNDLNKSKYKLKNVNTLFVNCAGQSLTDLGLANIRNYVESGGKLVTTDWAVERVVQQIFPDTIKRLGSVVTGDEVITIQPQGDLGKRLVGLDYEGANPKWWLENQSYPIEILNDSVVPIIKSDELNRKYGSPYVAVAFKWGEGGGLNFVSHIKAQRVEVRDQRDGQTIVMFSKMTQTVVPKGVDPDKTTLAGMETGYSTLSTVLEIVTQDMRNFVKSQNLAKADGILEITAHGYSSVNFNGQKLSDGNRVQYDLHKQINIGRNRNNEIVLGDFNISRMHARIFYDGDLNVKDLGSTNGVFVKGSKVSQAKLNSGDVVEIGPGKIEVKYL